MVETHNLFDLIRWSLVPGALPPAITFSQAWTRWGWRIGKKSPKAEGPDDFEPLVDSRDDVETQKSGVEEGGLGKLMHRLHHDLLVEHHETLKLAIPAGCYTLQNNLVFVALTNLSAAAAQWISFAMLAAGVVLVQSQDTKSYLVRVGGSPLLGGVAALGAAGLSGFAGVYLELMFTRTGSSLFMRNVQLALFSIPLQLYAIYQTDYAAVTNLGVRLGWTSLAPSFSITWAVVFIQFAGAMLTAIVIKYAGNILKTFATVLALLCTCFVSMLVFDFFPTPLFWVGVAVVSCSVILYSMPLVAFDW
ncbi:MAG: hypothetical protein SGPRY_005234 [Prymnesium sp.]